MLDQETLNNIKEVVSEKSTFRLMFSYLSKVFLFCILYYFSARIGLTIQPVNTFASFIWAPTGISLFVLFVFGQELWPAIFISAFIVNSVTGAPVISSLIIATGNTLEAVLGSYWLRLSNFSRSLNSISDLLKLIFFAALLSTFVSAFFGSFGLWLGGIISFTKVIPTLQAWWMGDALGVLLVGSFLFVMSTRPWIIFFKNKKKVFEGLILIVVDLFFNLLVFSGFSGIFVFSKNQSDLYLMVIPLLWAGLRFQQLGVTTGMIITATWVVLTTLNGQGPFSKDPSSSFLYANLFLTVFTVGALSLAAVVEEREAIRRELMQENEKKDQFLAILSHELRNPLASIFSNAELLELQQTPKDRVHVGYLKTIQRQSYHMRKLLDDLLDVSRISFGKIKLEKKLIDIRIVVANAIEEAMPLIEGKKQSLLVAQLDAPVIYEGDPIRLQQVIVNLLNNAAKYSDESTSISITIKEEVGTLLIKIKDSGIGISTDKLESIFELFARTDASYSRAKEGLGIGLKLAKDLVQLHGGNITVASEGIPGKGSEFTISLPMSGSQQRLFQIPSILDSFKKFSKLSDLRSDKIQQKILGDFEGVSYGAASEFGNSEEEPVSKKILVVDDSPELSRSLVRLFRYLGYETLEGNDGILALDLIDVEMPAVVFLDIGMPDMDGHEVVRRIRKKDNYKPLVVALTGYGQESDKLQAKRSGFDDYLIKPVGIAELSQLLKKYNVKNS